MAKRSHVVDKTRRFCDGKQGDGTEIQSVNEIAPHNNRRREPNTTGNNNSEIDRLFHLPGNSVSEVGDRMKGGAVKEDKSPENEAILINVQ